MKAAVVSSFDVAPRYEEFPLPTPAEGELVKKRYKIMRIGVNSALVEDTTFKGDNTQQTLPLEAEMNG